MIVPRVFFFGSFFLLLLFFFGVGGGGPPLYALKRSATVFFSIKNNSSQPKMRYVTSERYRKLFVKRFRVFFLLLSRKIPSNSIRFFVFRMWPAPDRRGFFFRFYCGPRRENSKKKEPFFLSFFFGFKLLEALEIDRWWFMIAIVGSRWEGYRKNGTESVPNRRHGRRNQWKLLNKKMKTTKKTQ